MQKLEINLKNEKISFNSYDRDETYYLDTKDFGNKSLNDILNFYVNPSYEWKYTDNLKKLYVKVYDDEFILITEGTKFNKCFCLLNCLNLKNLYLDIEDGFLMNFGSDEFRTFYGKIENLYIKKLNDIYRVSFNYKASNLFVDNKLLTYIEMKSDDYKYKYIYKYIHEIFNAFKSIRYLIFRKDIIKTLISNGSCFYYYYLNKHLENKIIIFEGTYTEFRKIYVSWYRANAIVVIPSDKNEYQAKANKIIKTKNLDFNNLDFDMLELLVLSQNEVRI